MSGIVPDAAAVNAATMNDSAMNHSAMNDSAMNDSATNISATPGRAAPRVVVLLSGRGSNLQALLDAQLPVEFAAVISNRPDAGGLDIARRAGIPAVDLDHKTAPDREAFDAQLAAEIDAFAPDLIVLAGYMRILTPGLVARYAGRMLNIHPSLLPAFTGLDTHARALAAGVKFAGCTVHVVTAELDHGPIVAQAAVPVRVDDTPATLAARVLVAEHAIYPQVLRWFAEGKLVLSTHAANLHDDTASQGIYFP